jgi:hypothetical protein
MSTVLLALACTFVGSVIGWVACNWHWQSRHTDSWVELRAATWRRQKRRNPVTPTRALDVADVIDAFGYGLMAESKPDGDESKQGKAGVW